MVDKENGRTHDYHAEANVVNGILELPLKREIQSQARVELPTTGGYISQYLDAYWLEGVMSYSSAYTQVAGNRDTKPGHGWTTLTTSVIEGLNILEVVTADRVIGQIITEHPLEGYVPRVNFLGTRFENLCVAGVPVSVEMNLGVLGAKPANDASYTSDAGVRERVASQYKHLLSHGDFPADLHDRYNRLSSTLRGAETVECSLVNRVTGSFAGGSFGHVIDIPDFGKVELGKLTVTSDDVDPVTQTPRRTTIALTMIELNLGCVTSGRLLIGPMVTNGESNP